MEESIAVQVDALFETSDLRVHELLSAIAALVLQPPDEPVV